MSSFKNKNSLFKLDGVIYNILYHDAFDLTLIFSLYKSA